MIVGSQEWHDLLFLHWRVPTREIRPHVHPRLSIDEREGSAWVSMTAFTLRNGRLRGLPPLPDFHELNFRTYVTHPRRGAGIWFFSLDAANTLAVLAARASVRLPYFPARIDRGEGWYRSERRYRAANFEARFSVGVGIGVSPPGSLEEFLVERYQLFSVAAGLLLWHGRIHHPPWKLSSATVTALREGLAVAAGMAPLGRPDSCQWSPGVDVEFEHFRLA